MYLKLIDFEGQKVIVWDFNHYLITLPFDNILPLPHSYSLLFAWPQCWAVPVCVCGWEGWSVFPQLCFHFLCSKAAGGAGDSGASCGGCWRQRGHASCHSQSWTTAGASAYSQVLSLNAAISYSVKQLCVSSEQSALQGLTKFRTSQITGSRWPCCF